jgi:hypothetical protein
VRTFVVVLLVVVIALGAYSVASDSGGASEPIMSPVAATTEAGSSAVSSIDIDPRTCDGVLSPATGDLSLDTQALTDSAKESQPQVASMCSAIYQSDGSNGEFLTLALMQFDSDESAIEHYELMKSVFVESDVPISEVNSADEGLIDQVSGHMDSDGIGRIDVFRQREWVVSVSVGPKIEDSPWVGGDIGMIGRSVLGRVK